MKFAPFSKWTYLTLGIALLLISGCANLRFIRGTSPRVEQQAWETLETLVRAYEQQNVTMFMEQVDENYIGQDRILESAVQHDFSRFARINLDINLVGSSRSLRGDQVQMSVNFKRQVTPVDTGMPVSDSGLAQFIFINRDGTWKLLAMRGDLMFGVSLEE